MSDNTMRNWTASPQLHASTIEATLTPDAQTLLLTFANGHIEQLQRDDIEALTRFLDKHANVRPLSALQEDVFAGFEPTKVNTEEE